MDLVLLKAQELADAIRQSEPFLAMKRSEERMKMSPAAEQANAAYDAAYQAVREAIRQTPEKRQEAAAALRKARDVRNACPEIAEYVQAEQDFSQMMENVNQLLRLIVSESLTDGGCAASGTCSACGGCCR